MNFSVLFRRIHKGPLLFIVILLLAGYSVHEADSSSGGIVGYSKSGCTCHGSKSTATVINIYPDSAQIIAGKTYVFYLKIANTTEKAAGFDMSTSSGGMLAVNGSNSGLQFYKGELTQTSPRTFTGDSAVWTFNYTAPKTPGVAHIYVAGNAVNLDRRADAADHWNTLTYTVNVVSSGVESNDNVASDVSIYPNPSRGQITIGATGLSGDAIAQVSDAAGRIVHAEPVTLSNEMSLDLTSLPNGPYFLSIRTRDGLAFTRNIVIQK